MSPFQYLLQLVRQAWPFLLQVGGGSVTGYQTNKWALRLLFREYWGFGGYIVKTRRQFTDNISELVESDIINARTLRPRLRGDELQRQARALVLEFFETQLPAATRGARVGDIPGSSSSVARCAAFLESRGGGLVGPVLNLVLPEVRLATLLGTRQRGHVIGRVVDLAFAVLREGELLRDLLVGLYDENMALRVSDLLPPAVFERLVTNLEASTADLHVRLRDQHEQQLDELWCDLSTELEIGKFLEKLERQLLSRTPADLLGRHDGQEVLDDVLGWALAFLDSEEGQAVIRDFLESAIEVARESAVPFTELVGAEVWDSLASLLEQGLPDIIETLIGWIQANKAELEDLVEEAVTETLEEQSSGSSGVMASLRQWLYKSFARDDLTRQFGLIGRIITVLEEDTGVEAVHSLAENITGGLSSYLGTRTLGELVQLLENNGLIDIAQLAQTLVSALRILLDSVDLSPLAELLDTDLGERLNAGPGDVKPLGTLLAGGHEPDRLAWEQFKTAYLFTPQFTRAIQQVGSGWLQDSYGRRFGELLGDDGLQQYSFSLAAWILKRAGEVRSLVAGSLTQAVSELAETTTLADVVDRTGLGAVVSSELASLLKARSASLRELPLAALCDRLSTYEPLLEGSGHVLIDVLDQHLGTLLPGRVAELVAASLDELPDERLRALVEDFMGKHLGPITWLGALVGGSIGTLLHYLQVLGWNATGYFHAALVYGFAGWITNVMALWAIFKPYEEKHLLGLPIPLTPGIVTRNKPRFATSMGEFVDEKLLSAESLREAFRDNREAAETALEAYLTERGPGMVLEVLRANDSLAAISSSVVTLARAQARRDKEQLARWLAGAVGGVRLEQFDLEAAKGAARAVILEGLDGLAGFLSSRLALLLDTDRPVGEVAPGFIQSALHEEVGAAVRSGLASLPALLSDPHRVHGTLVASLKPVLDSWSQKTVGQLTGAGGLVLDERLARYLVQRLKSPERRRALVDWLGAGLSAPEALGADRTIRELVGGSLLRLAAEHSDLLVDTLVDRGLRLLAGQRDAIKDLVAAASRETNPLLAVLNLRRVTDEVVDRVIDAKLPIYLERHRDEAQALVDRFIASLGERGLGGLGLATVLGGFEQLLEKLVSGPRAAESITRFMEPLIRPVRELQLASVLSFLDVARSEDVLRRFRREVELAAQHLAERLRENPARLEASAARTARHLFDGLLMQLPVAAAARGISPDSLAPSTEAFVNRLHSSPALHSALDRYLEQLRQHVAASTAADFTAAGVLVDDLDGLLESLLDNDALFEALQAEAEKLIVGVGKALPELLDADTWDYVVSVVVQALLEAMAAKLPELVSAVDLAEVTEDELRQMSPAKIEELFNSFASGYFARLRLYGWFGAGFGLLVEALRQAVLGM